MAFQLNDGQITLNAVPPQEGKKMPSLKGKVKIFGISIPVVLWTKTTSEGKKWWSGHIGEDAPVYGGNIQPQASAPVADQDELPF
jgi:hypothetical protein